MKKKGDEVEKLIQLSFARSETCKNLSFPEKICGSKKILYSNIFIVTGHWRSYFC